MNWKHSYSLLNVIFLSPGSWLSLKWCRWVVITTIRQRRQVCLNTSKFIVENFQEFIRAADHRNEENDLCAQRTQISLGICPVWSVLTVHLKKPWILSYPLSAQGRLNWLGECPFWSESSLGAQVILLVLSSGGSFCLKASIVKSLGNSC